MSASGKHFLIPPHLSDDKLVAYLDGELSRAEMEAARSHVGSCWSCRTRAAEVQAGIDKFMQARAEVMPDESFLADSRVEQFRQRLARHAIAVEAELTPLQERIESWGSRFRGQVAALLQHRQVVLASVVAVCLLVAMFTDSLNTRVSADTVLHRAQNYETIHLPEAGTVTRSSVRVERLDHKNNLKKELGTFTLVRDSASSLTYVSAQAISGEVQTATVKDVKEMAKPLLQVLMSDGNVASSLGQYLGSQQWVPDVSVAEFRQLAGWGIGGEALARRQGGTFELYYPFAPNHPSGIAGALLRVDAGSYSLMSLSIFTRGDDSEYRFTRTSFSPEPRTTEMARLFAPGEVSKLPPSAGRALPEVKRPVPLSYANSHASEAEVSVAEALHRADACLGEEIYLFPMSDGSLLVQGLVDSSARRDIIRQALKSVPGPLRVEVYVPRELKSGSELYPSPDPSVPESPSASGSPAATLADLSGATMPLHETLYAHFYKPGSSAEDVNKQVALFSDEIVTLARQTFLHAWALKRLDREFSAERTSGLPAAVLQQVEEMRRDHDRWISSITRRQTDMLSPIAGPDITSGVAQAVAGRESSDALLRLAQEQNELVRSLFTTSQRTPETANSLTRLMVVLRHLGS
jgi:anti-sigma factor RsiW